jgi:hypothetical protein
MVYGYIRVSTDKQTVENQRFEINRFCKTEKIKIEKWIEETISGTKTLDKRKLGDLLKLVKEGDIIICSELSRLGRSFFMIMSILSGCMERGVKIGRSRTTTVWAMTYRAKCLRLRLACRRRLSVTLSANEPKSRWQGAKQKGWF